MIYYFIFNEEETKCCHIDEHGVIDYENITYDLQLTELENLPINVLINPKLYLKNDYIISKLKCKNFNISNIIELRRMIKIIESANILNKFN